MAEEKPLSSIRLSTSTKKLLDVAKVHFNYGSFDELLNEVLGNYVRSKAPELWKALEKETGNEGQSTLY